MRLLPVVASLFVAAAVSYFLYIPLPAAIQEPWKLMMLDAGFKTVMRLAALKHRLGLGHYLQTVRAFTRGFDTITVTLGRAKPAASAAAMIVGDTDFDGIPVRVYEPPPGAEGHLRRGLMFLHGGGWALGSAKHGMYDSIGREISKELDAVVVSVEYSLYPEVHFPVPYLDCLAAAKYFLSPEVLAKYAIDPVRVAVSGDSAGGNLAAAVAQQISTDDSVSVKFSVQALVYPVLQTLDFNTPSYLQNAAVPILYRPAMVLFWLQYLGADISLRPRLLANNHSSLQQAAITPELRARVDWTVLLEQKFRKDYQPVVVERESGTDSELVPALLDVRAAPLLAGPEVLAKCPRAYILTCEHDVLRDDGLMYARRLQDAGVTVTSDHFEDGFHGCFTFLSWPFDFDVGRRALRSYISWLQTNL